MCSSIILGEDVYFKQIGYSINNSLFCYACSVYCREGQQSSKIVDNVFMCQCKENNDKKCLFADCQIISDNHKRFKAITDMISAHSEEIIREEKEKIKKEEEKNKKRTFNFQSSYFLIKQNEFWITKSLTI